MKRPQVGWLLDLPDFHFPPAALLLFWAGALKLNFGMCCFLRFCKLLLAKPSPYHITINWSHPNPNIPRMFFNLPNSFNTNYDTRWEEYHQYHPSNKLNDLKTLPRGTGEKNTQMECCLNGRWLSFCSCFLHLYLMYNVTTTTTGPIRYTSLSDISI